MSIEDWPPTVQKLILQANDLFTQGKLSEATTYTRQALELLPDDEMIINSYGNLLLKQGDRAGAYQQFKKATILFPASVSGFINLAVVYLLENNLEEASRVIQTLSLAFPGNSEITQLKQYLESIKPKPVRQITPVMNAPDQTPNKSVIFVDLQNGSTPAVSNHRCKICGSYQTYFIGQKSNQTLYQCVACEYVFIDNDHLNDNKVGGESELPRNDEVANQGRLARLNKPNTVLDYGCGHGYFVDYCNHQGVNACGIDLYTELQLSNLNQSFDAITMIEVIEHLSDPIPLLKEIMDHLNPGGVFYIESSFLDTIEFQSVESFLSWPYVAPQLGHISYYSQKTMEVIANLLGLKLVEKRFNPNVFRLTK
jgi:hypothetical protein